MKKTLLILCLSIAAFTSKAQNMSFDETVKYINDKLAVSKYPKIMAAKNNGTITLQSINKAGNIDPDSKKAFNLFDISQKPIDDSWIVKQDKGLFIYYNDNLYAVTHTTGESNFIAGSIAYFESGKDAERLFSALVYLRSLCTPAKDPFDK